MTDFSLVEYHTHSKRQLVGFSVFLFFTGQLKAPLSFSHPPQWGHNRTDLFVVGFDFFPRLQESNSCECQTKVGIQWTETWILIVHWTSRDTWGRSGVRLVFLCYHRKKTILRDSDLERKLMNNTWICLRFNLKLQWSHSVILTSWSNQVC